LRVAGGIEVSMIRIPKTERDFPLSDFTASEWKKAAMVNIATSWDGTAAAPGRRFSARLIYSDVGLYVLFTGKQNEDLVISMQPVLNKKSIGLWERDVFEIFLAPEAEDPKRYFEFEVSPVGEWLDVALEILDGNRVSDWNFCSGMQVVSRIEIGQVAAALFIPFRAFGIAPVPGDVWRGNLFRCIGHGPDRGFLAWKPTHTPKPDFHVPAAFGRLEFTGIC
jgi:alpha-galactosidase